MNFLPCFQLQEKNYSDLFHLEEKVLANTPHYADG